MESHGLMFELSHPERINILHLLKEKPRRLSQLSKELDVNTAEVSRHLDRLGKAGLIDRDSSNNYNLTTFANIILSEVSKFDFLTTNIEYFLKHDVSCIPEHLHWFNVMAKGSLSKGTLETTSLIKETSENAEKFVYVISNEVMRGMVDIDCKKNDKGVVFKKIYPRDAPIPGEYESRMGESFDKLMTKSLNQAFYVFFSRWVVSSYLQHLTNIQLVNLHSSSENWLRAI